MERGWSEKDGAWVFMVLAFSYTERGKTYKTWKEMT